MGSGLLSGLPRWLLPCLLLWTLAVGGCAQAPVKKKTGPYPIENGLAATVVGTPPAYRADLPTGLDFTVRELEPLAERDTPATLRYARPLRYLLVTQDQPAPLAFVIAGTGANALSSNCVALSRALYAEGYHVACLPSPTSVTFILGAAQHPVPGRMSSDVRDIYRLMQAVRNDLADDTKITGYALTGWSLGATQAAFLDHYDQSRADGAFDFKRVLMINPAVDVWASVRRMDRLLARNLEGGIDGIPEFVARGLGSLRQIYASNDPLQFNEDFLYRAYLAQSPDRRDIAAIIGLAFRLALANMAFAADAITQSDVIVPRDVTLGPYDSLDPYIQRAFRLSFDDYIEQLLLPYWNHDGRGLTRAELVAEGDLRNIRRYLLDNPRIEVLTNANDPILDEAEVSFLRTTFGSRARIRPRGGHLGNLRYRGTIRALQRYFSP